LLSLALRHEAWADQFQWSLQGGSSVQGSSTLVVEALEVEALVVEALVVEALVVEALASLSVDDRGDAERVGWLGAGEVRTSWEPETPLAVEDFPLDFGTHRCLRSSNQRRWNAAETS